MCDFDSETDPRSQIIHMKKIQAEGLELFIKKNADYGNSYKQYGLIGVLVRLQDKINRCLNITKNGIHVQDESLRDTLIDLHNYAAMALMESEPTVPNLPKTCEPIRSYSSEPLSEAKKVSNVRTSESFRDKSLPKFPRDSLLSLSAAERACIDQCINLR